MKKFFLFFLFLSLFVVDARIGSWKEIFTNFSQTKLSNISEKCLAATNFWLNSLETFSEISENCLLHQNCTKEEEENFSQNLFAVEQLDAFGKLPTSGLFNIPLLWDGSYQECERVNGIHYDTNYCYLTLVPGFNSSCSTSSEIQIRTAICMPKSCSNQDLINIFNQLTEFPLTACKSACSSVEVEKDSGFWGFSSFLMIIIIICIVSTAFDYFFQFSKTKNIYLKIFLSFSFWTNAELILSVKEQKPDFIKCLDCIRALSMLWVVTGHTCMYLQPPDELQIVDDFFSKLWNHLILNAFFSVDTFFVLSGVVVAYLFFKKRLNKTLISSPITWILFYTHRYLRLTPPMIIFIGFFTTYAQYIQGPFSASMMNSLSNQAEICRSTWWKNLIYINNFGEKTCYGITWYLAVDTQIFLAIPIVLLAFYFSFLCGLLVTILACFGSIVATYFIYDSYDISADFFGNGNVDLFHSFMYIKPWIRCTPYLLGILTGYILGKNGKKSIKIHPFISIFAWLISLGIAVACLFSTFDYDKGAHWSIFNRATYYNFSRLLWSIGICWIIISNHMGWSQPINSFMSHPIWQPFGRLSYCAYLVHWMILYFSLNIGDKSPHYYSVWQLFAFYSLPATIFSFIFAFFWSCIFEIPTLKIEKILIDALINNKKLSSDKECDDEKNKHFSRL